MPDSVSERVSPPRLATEGQCAEDYCFMANCRGVAECWSQPNSKHSNVNVVRPSWPCESDARTYKLAPPDGGSGSAGSLNEGTLPGTYPGAAGRAGAVLGASSAPVRVRDHKRATRLVALRATAGQGSDAQARRWHTRSACKARALLRPRLAARCLHARYVT